MAKKITVKRKELFEDLWNIGYDRSAEKYDVSLIFFCFQLLTVI